MKKKRIKIFISLLLISLLLCVGGILIYHPQGEKIFSNRIQKEVLTANIQIMQQATWGGETSSGTSWSAVTSGTIIKKDGQRYYVLTAYHVIKPQDGSESTKIIIMDYTDKYYIEANVDRQITQDEYYSQFPEAKVEFYDPGYDLAVISFLSDKNYKIIEISNELPKFGDSVGAISNPNDNGKNQITVGRIISIRPTISLLKKDGITYPLLTHTARTSNGSSGSMLLNENMELVGVNLGGAELKVFAFRFFLAGKSMPCDSILKFLAANKFDM